MFHQRFSFVREWNEIVSILQPALRWFLSILRQNKITTKKITFPSKMASFNEWLNRWYKKRFPYPAQMALTVYYWRWTFKLFTEKERRIVVMDHNYDEVNDVKFNISFAIWYMKSITKSFFESTSIIWFLIQPQYSMMFNTFHGGVFCLAHANWREKHFSSWNLPSMEADLQ